MSIRNKIKTSTGILTVATFSMASLVAAYDHGGATTSSESATMDQVDEANCIVMADAKPNPCAANACNPCAANPCGGCNPCGANPCAAKSCNPCAAANPCAANPCSANPCAAANPCGGCNPCAANPCAANPCGGCNPCAANPCAAANPCGGCNPCAANPCGGCNPCAAANACNPCAGANPCGGCNPCNPCAGSAGGKSLSGDEMEASYDCSKDVMSAGYARGGNDTAKSYTGWARFNSTPYPSATHGGRMVNNYANEIGAEEYGKFEEIGTMPVGSILAKDSLVFDKNGMPSAGPLFLMEKMPAGFMSDSGDWKYTMVMPNGSVWGETLGKNTGGVQFCIDCHFAAEDYDYLFFLPPENRK